MRNMQVNGERLWQSLMEMAKIVPQLLREFEVMLTYWDRE